MIHDINQTTIWKKVEMDNNIQYCPEISAIQQFSYKNKISVCRKRWMIEKGGKKGLGISVLMAWHDDDDDERYKDFIIIIIFKSCLVQLAAGGGVL